MLTGTPFATEDGCYTVALMTTGSQSRADRDTVRDPAEDRVGGVQGERSQSRADRDTVRDVRADTLRRLEAREVSIPC